MDSQLAYTIGMGQGIESILAKFRHRGKMTIDLIEKRLSELLHLSGFEISLEMANIYMLDGQLESALGHAEAAIREHRVDDEVDSIINLIRCFEVKGTILATLRPNDFEAKFREALSWFGLITRNGNKKIELVRLVTISKLFFFCGRWQESYLIKKGLERHHHVLSLEDRLSIQTDRAEIDFATGEVDKALDLAGEIRRHVDEVENPISRLKIISSIDGILGVDSIGKESFSDQLLKVFREHSQRYRRSFNSPIRYLSKHSTFTRS